MAGSSIWQLSTTQWWTSSPGRFKMEEPQAQDDEVWSTHGPSGLLLGYKVRILDVFFKSVVSCIRK